MNRKNFAAVIAVVAALVIYNGGWEIIKHFGEQVWPIVGSKAIIFGIATIALIFCTIVIPCGIYKKITR